MRYSELSLAAGALLLFAAGRCAAADPPTLTEQYRGPAEKLIAAALADTEGYGRLEYLCDRIGHRLSGSPALDRAIQWSAEQMKAAGLSNVRILPVKVPHWVRGAESVRMLEPLDRPLHALGLGMSVGTPPGGITAEVVAVSSFAELEKLGREKVQGRIVLYDEPYQGYGQTVTYRGNGASRAAALGAVAALVRSVTPLGMQTPHTGTMRYDPNQPKIPAAAVSPEDAMSMARLCAAGVPVKVHLEMGAHQEPDADSGNVIGEIPGREHPEEIVVIGGHSDSWDVGQGAQDDGAAIMASLQAVALMKKLGLQPRRTIRVAFWVNEENGSRGGDAYRAWVGRCDRQPCGGHRNGRRRGDSARVRRRRRRPIHGAAAADRRSAPTDRRRRDRRRRRRRGHPCNHGRRRTGPERGNRRNPLLRLASYRGRYPGQGESRGLPQERGRDGGNGLRPGRHARQAGLHHPLNPNSEVRLRWRSLPQMQALRIRVRIRARLEPCRTRSSEEGFSPCAVDPRG